MGLVLGTTEEKWIASSLYEPLANLTDGNLNLGTREAARFRGVLPEGILCMAIPLHGAVHSWSDFCPMTS